MYGLHIRDQWITTLSGFIFVMTGIFIFINGIDIGTQIFKNAWTDSFSLVFFGFGLYIMLRTLIEYVQEEFNLLK